MQNHHSAEIFAGAIIGVLQYLAPLLYMPSGGEKGSEGFAPQRLVIC
jgi:hypothetical protein